MKLQNQSLKYLSLALFVIIGIWSVLFYSSMFREIKNSIDEELEHQKRLIIQNTLKDSVIVEKPEFDENLYTIKHIAESSALKAKDEYLDSDLLMQDADDLLPEPEPVRILSTVFKAKNNYYQLKIAQPILEENDLLKALLWNVIGLYFLLLLSLILINNLVLKRLWKPFYDFLSQLKEFKIQAATPLKTSNTNIKEFKDLETAVSEMNLHSLNAFNQQKEFIENASHELQTPLGMAINKLELLFESDELDDFQAQKLNETYKILKRLTKLNKSLLLLSKIENKQISNSENISINEVVEQIVKELEDYAVFKNIKIEVELNGELSKKMDKTHAHTLISNLLFNAIYHNKENGEINVSISRNQLTISNTGSLIALDESKIFNRFQKGNASANGTGLGLAIVKAITKLYQLDLTYSFKDKKHYFSINF